jgi:hypothetical protein
MSLLGLRTMPTQQEVTDGNKPQKKTLLHPELGASRIESDSDGTPETPSEDEEDLTPELTFEESYP